MDSPYFWTSTTRSTELHLHHKESTSSRSRSISKMAVPLLRELLILFCILCSCNSLSSSASNSVEAFDVSAKCPHILTPSSLKLPEFNRDNVNSTSLRVLVPWKVGFEQFVSFNPDSCRLDGFSVQVFLQALTYMQHPSPPQYQFVLYGAGNETPAYDDMIDMLVSKDVDAVVADLTITRERMEKVGFTVPYLASSLVMVTPFRYGSSGTLWDFLRPFSRNLWITLLVCFAATGLVLYLLEDQNPDFAITTKKREGEVQASSDGGGSSTQQARATSAPNVPANASPPPSPSSSTHDPHPPTPPSTTLAPDNHGTPPPLTLPSNSNNTLHDDVSSLQRPGPPIYDQASHKRRIMNAYWFTSLCVFQSQQESVRTHFGRTVTITWLFVMLIFNSSYTASLASLLSAQKRYPTIEDFQALKKDVNVSVGYQEGSFMRTFMKKLRMDKHKLKSFTSEGDSAEALRKGNLYPNGIGAILDELPYIQILLQSECDFTTSSVYDDHLPSFGGFGFAFQKGDTLLERMSQMILAMAEDGTLQRLRDWKIGDNKGGRCNTNEDPSHLRLRSFGGLFSIVAVVYTICIIWRFSGKINRSPQGRCINLNQALPCAQPHGSTMQQARELSLSRRSNRVTDESCSGYASST